MDKAQSIKHLHSLGWSQRRTARALDEDRSLSAVGDWDSVTTEGTSQSRTHGPTHELLTAGRSSVSTDVKGNITLIPSAVRPNSQSLAMHWDFDNRLNTADVGNNSSIDVTYKFDALGRRVFRDDGTNAVVYVQAGQQTIADYPSGTAASSPTYRYVYGSYIDEPVLRYKPSTSESLYYHRNQQYSIVALSNASGVIVERYAYSGYGAPTITDGSGSSLSASAYNNRYTYTGREWDAALYIYHYRARMYEPTLGRFCSRDPIEYSRTAWNLYTGYFASMAVMDPGGNDWVLPWDPNAQWWFPFSILNPNPFAPPPLPAGGPAVPPSLPVLLAMRMIGPCLLGAGVGIGAHEIGEIIRTGSVTWNDEAKTAALIGCIDGMCLGVGIPLAIAAPIPIPVPVRCVAVPVVCLALHGIACQAASNHGMPTPWFCP